MRAIYHAISYSISKYNCKGPFTRSDFKDPVLGSKIGSRRSDGPISRFRFCGENVGRSFVTCSHDQISRTYKDSSIWRQNDYRDIMQNLSAPFIFQEKSQMKIEHVLFPFVLSELLIRVLEGHFQSVHTIRISEPTKIRSLKTDPSEQALKHLSNLSNNIYVEQVLRR